jgi:hypothetical protein
VVLTASTSMVERRFIGASIESSRIPSCFFGKSLESLLDHRVGCVHRLPVCH